MAPLRILMLLVFFACAASTAAAEEAGNPKQAELTAADAPSRGAANVPPDVARKAAAIARQTMSPFCPGRTLSDCPSEYATEWRKDIRAMVASGMSAPEIQRELESRAGSNLSGSPNRDVGWSVPIGLMLGAGLLLIFVFSKLRPRSASGSGASEPKTPSTKATDSGPKNETTAHLGDEETARGEATETIDDSRIDEELERI